MNVKKQIEQSIDFLEKEVKESEIKNEPNDIKKIWLVILEKIEKFILYVEAKLN